MGLFFWWVWRLAYVDRERLYPACWCVIFQTDIRRFNRAGARMDIRIFSVVLLGGLLVFVVAVFVS